MKIKIIIILIVAIIISLLISIVATYNHMDASLYNYEKGSISDYPFYKKYYDDIKRIVKDIPDKGTIPNAKSARKVAKEIFCSNSYRRYSDEVDIKLYKVKYDEENKLWIVIGWLPENLMGSVPYVAIQKDDGKVLGLWFN